MEGFWEKNQLDMETGFFSDKNSQVLLPRGGCVPVASKI